MTARRCLPQLAVLALVVPTLSSCQLLGGGSSLDDALEVVPGDATSVTFVDRAALADRLGVEDADVDEYLEKTRDDPVGGTPLAQYVEPMQDAAFSELDVAWSVLFTGEDGVTTVYKVDDVDLDDLVSDLEDVGLDSRESDGRTTFEAADLSATDPESGLLDGRYPFDFTRGVVVDPDESLVVTGAGTGTVVDVLDDDEDSLTDSGAYDDLLDGVDDVELASLSDDPPCQSGRTEPEPDGSEISGLGTTSAQGLFVGGDDATVTARLQFADDEAAESDLEAREKYLEDGHSLRTAQPISDLGSAELEQDGDTVTMELDLERPSLGIRLAADGDAFFACTPKA